MQGIRTVPRRPYWNHDTNDLEFALADSVSSLAYANHLLAKVEDSEGDAEEEEGETKSGLSHIAEEFKRISERVRLSWHDGKLEEVAEAKGCYEGSINALYYFYRSLWINYLLRNDGVHELGAVADAFDLVDQGEQDLDQVIAAGSLSRYPLWAFYWLWRLFFLNKAEKLRDAIAIAGASANPVVRDMTLLVKELQNGRRRLGSIEDIHALREDFLKLDLDPDRAEERARDEAERERLAAEQKAADERRVAQALVTCVPEELVALAWAEALSSTAMDRARQLDGMGRRRAAPEPGKALPQSEPMGGARWPLGGMVNGMRFSADGERLIAVGGGGVAAVVDRNGAEVMGLSAVRLMTSISTPKAGWRRWVSTPGICS
jgi:hypothetical protein